MKRWRPHLLLIPTREGTYYIAVLLFVLTGSVLREINLMLALAGLMLGPVLLSLLGGLISLRSVTIRRRMIPVARVGQPHTIELFVSSGRRRLSSWLIWINDRWVADDSARTVLRGSAIVARLSAKQTVRVSYRCLPQQRGRYTAAPVEISTRFPLGLVRHSRLITAPERLLVLPRVGRLTPAWSKLLRPLSPNGSQRRHPQHAAQGDFFGLREWRPGDNKRAVHWRSSARRGTLIVRQFEQPRHQEFALLLDLWQPLSPTADDRAAVERAVSFAATLIGELWQRGGGRLTLSIGDRNCQTLSAALSSPFQQIALERLALAQASADVDQHALVRASLQQAASDATFIWIGTRPTARVPFAAASGDADTPARRQVDVLAKMLTFNAHGKGLDDYFELDA